jgi:release factor glutamine methyltransferase
MRPEFQDFIDHLRAAKLEFEVAPDFSVLPETPSLDSQVYSEVSDEEWPAVGVLREERDPEQALHANHATHDVARLIAQDRDLLPGARVLEIGCGSGMLAIQAARLGAEVIATEICSDSLALARRNAELNAVAIDFREGHLFEPVRGEEPFDFILANLPHKPGEQSEGLPLSQAGGPEGDALWAEAQADIAALSRPRSRFHFFLHSLPSPQLLLRLAGTHQLVLRTLKLRRLGPREYGRELRQRFRDRSEEGLSFLHRDEGGEALVAASWTAIRR